MCVFFLFLLFISTIIIVVSSVFFHGVHPCWFVSGV